MSNHFSITIETTKKTVSTSRGLRETMRGVNQELGFGNKQKLRRNGGGRMETKKI